MTTALLFLFLFFPFDLNATPLNQLIREEFKPKKYILSIGINHFQDKIFTQLAYAQNDAESIYHYFHSIGFDDGELIDSPFVSLRQVSKALNHLENVLKVEDTLIIYISSHGTRGYNNHESLDRYLVTSDTSSEDLPATAMPFERLLHQFRSLNAGKKALILAFCHAGEGKSGVSEKERQALLYAKGDELPELSLEAFSEGSFIYAASMQNQAAYENPELKHDIYTYFLLQAFEKSHELKTLARAHDYAAERTHSFVYKHLGRIQTPTATTAVAGSPAICIDKKGCHKNKPTIYAKDFRQRNFQLEINGIKYADLGKAVTASKGFNHITVSSHGHKIYDDTIYLQNGLEYPINKFLSSSKSESFLVGSSTLNFTNRAFRKKFAPKLVRGISINYLRDNLLDVCDLSLGLNYFPSTKELITDEKVDLLEHEHKRTTFTFNLFLGKKYYFDSLSLKTGNLLTYLRYQGGLSLLHHQSQISSSAFSERNHFGQSPGPGVSLALESHIPSVGLSFGYQQTLAYYGAKDVNSGAQSGQIFLGKYW